MGKQRLLLLGLAAGALAAAGSANAAYHITGLDLYGHGVVTSADQSTPSVGTKELFHVTMVIWPPFVGNPYPPIDSDATGTYHYSTIGGPWGFEVNIRDSVGGWAGCEVCDATFSLVDGALSGPFSFDAGVDPVHYVALNNTSFFGQVLGPDFSTTTYTGTFALDSVLIHTDAPVPEPASWLLMITGFLGAGQALRSARRSAARTQGAPLG